VALVIQHALLVKAAPAGITGGHSGAETGQTSTGCPHSASLQLPTRHLEGLFPVVKPLPPVSYHPSSFLPSTSTTTSGSVKAVGEVVTGAVEVGVEGAQSSDPGLKPCPLVLALLALALVTMLQLRGGC